jgi:hypothetical protein
MAFLDFLNFNPSAENVLSTRRARQWQKLCVLLQREGWQAVMGTHMNIHGIGRIQKHDSASWDCEYHNYMSMPTKARVNSRQVYYVMHKFVEIKNLLWAKKDFIYISLKKKVSE